MTVLPSPDEQRTIIQSLERDHPLQSGIPAHLIEARWFADWKDYVSYDGIDPFITSLGPIDNNQFFVNGEITGQERHNFYILSQPVWSQLFEWYGGGPDVPAETIFDYRSNEARAMVHKVQFEFVDSTRAISHSAYALTTVGALKKTALDLFGLPADTESRLIDYWNNQVYAILDDDKYLDQCHIQQGQKIFVDTKDASGQWQKDATPATSATGSSWSWGSSGGGSYGASQGPGKCGLRNLGNTCFFNSAVQCLLHTMPFARHFLGGWAGEINSVNRLGTQGKVARAFAGVVESMWRGSAGVIDPYDLKFEVGEFAPQFQGWGQQDSHELMTFLLDALHEDLNRCLTKPLVEAVAGDGSNDAETAQKAWRNHLARNDSIVVDLFHGQLRSKLICPSPECGRTTVVFDPYVAVQLPIDKTGRAKPKLVGVKFVPLDFAAPPVPLAVVLTANPSSEEVSRVVSAALGRDVQAVLGIKGYAQEVSWDLHKLHNVDEYSRSWAEPWVFEISSRDRLWMVATLKVPMKNASYGGCWDEPLIGPFLLPLDDDRNVERAAEARLAWLWPASVHGSRPPLSPDALALKKKIVLPSDAWRDNEPLIQARTWPSDIEPAVVPFVTNSATCITLTATAVSRDSRFDFDGLLAVAAAFGAVSVPTVDARSPAITLEDCFNQFAQTEVLDEENKWFCPHCRQFVCAAKTMEVWSAPRVLVVQLKRFVTSRYLTSKLETTVEYPDELDMSPFLANPQRDATAKYRLYAVSEHSGSLGGGHYTAHALVQDAGTSQWFNFNDSSAWAARAEDAHSSSAYLLFYQRIGAGDDIIPLPEEEAVAVTTDAEATAIDEDSESIWKSDNSDSLGGDDGHAL